MGRKIQILGKENQSPGKRNPSFFLPRIGTFQGLAGEFEWSASLLSGSGASAAAELRPLAAAGRLRGCFSLQTGGDAVQLGEQPLARRLIVDRIGLGRALVAVELGENLEIRRDRSDLAVSDPLRREPKRVFEAGALQHRMVRSAVDLLAPQRLADDLAHAPRRHPLLARDVLISPAQAQARENALPPQRLAIGVEPRPLRKNRLIIHCPPRFLPRWRLFWEQRDT